ncbi:MAG: DUF3488 domain-containing protein, partial [Planctomycetia bacterium]|nr:DUF3488 domain-containing protein [Planctomycetia bacterium]
MTLTAVFQFSLYTLVALAGTMLAYGEETFFPSGLTVFLSGLVLFVNERQGRLRMRPLAGNLLGLAALGAAAYEFFGDRPDSRLLAGAHFLVYITWIVLFQAKDIRQYWWLCALSLLQVAVGSVLTSMTGSYGLLLLAYLPLALWTLSVFTLYQGAYELGGLDHERPGGNAATPPAAAATSATAALDPLALDPAALLRQCFAPDRRSSVRHAIQQDSPGRWIVPRFVFGVIGLAVTGLALGLVMFLFVPRVSFGSGVRFQGEGTRGQALTGFSGEVRLGQIGQILENLDRVMRVRIFERVDGQKDKPLSIKEFAYEFGLDAPLFRGSVLDEYRQGRWRGGKPHTVTTHVMPSHPLEPGLIRQEYALDISGSEFLFAMRPISLARLYDPPGPINYVYETGVFAGGIERRDPIEYLVYSRRRTPRERDARRNQFGALPGREKLSVLTRMSCLQLPDEGIDGVVRLAGELTEPGRLTGDETMSLDRRKAETLSAHLRDSNEYAYSLNMEVVDPNRDPIEEFLVVRKRGHCEYFASALALMLRSIKIPARLVTGFKGAEYHENDRSYEVQQRHGHVWVEAYIDDEWIVLDPTPGARDEMVFQVGANAGFWKNAKHSISTLWSTYVVSLSLNRQQEALYDPLTGGVSAGWARLRDLLAPVGTGIGWV